MGTHPNPGYGALWAHWSRGWEHTIALDVVGTFKSWMCPRGHIRALVVNPGVVSAQCYKVLFLVPWSGECTML